MPATIDKIARDLGVKTEELLTDSVLAYLEKKKAGTLRSMLEITAKYNITSSHELEQKIKKGTVSEHPTWEDLITLQNLEKSLKDIDSELAYLHRVGKLSAR
jgi:transposase-like protein